MGFQLEEGGFVRRVKFQSRHICELGVFACDKIDPRCLPNTVEQVYPDLVAHSAGGKIETVKYQVLDSMLLNEVQKQNAQLAAQKEQINQQKEQNTEQQKKIESLEERLARLESLLEQATTRTALR